MRKFYYPESIADWERNLTQTGGGLPRYSGVAYQRGQGIGSFFKGLFRSIWPTLKSVGISAGKEAIQAGSEATRDYLNDGIDFKHALKRRGKQALGRTVGHLGKHIGQHGKGVGIRTRGKKINAVKRITLKKSKIKRNRKRKGARDIYH